MPVNIQEILRAFDSTGCSLSDFLRTLLTSPDYQTHTFAGSVAGTLDDVLHVFITSQSTAKGVSQWAHKIVARDYQSQVELLSQKGSGFHFLARKVTEEQTKGFSIEHVASEMRRIAPDLWNLLGILLSADQRVKYRRTWSQQKVEAEKGIRKRKVEKEPVELELGDEEFDAMSDDGGEPRVDIEGAPTDEDEDEPENLEEQEKEQKEALTTIASPSCTSQR